MTNIHELLKQGVVTFKYTKKNGEERTARGTLKMDIIEEHDALPKGGESPATRAGYISYFDLDKEGWRCFDECAVTEVVNEAA